jgi:hypothetical protein
MLKLKKVMKYLILGGFIGMLLVYLKFKRVKLEE